MTIFLDIAQKFPWSVQTPLVLVITLWNSGLSGGCSASAGVTCREVGWWQFQIALLWFRNIYTYLRKFLLKGFTSWVSPIPSVHVSSFQIHSLKKYQDYYSFQSLLSSSLEKKSIYSLLNICYAFVIVTKNFIRTLNILDKHKILILWYIFCIWKIKG